MFGMNIQQKGAKKIGLPREDNVFSHNTVCVIFDAVFKLSH